MMSSARWIDPLRVDSFAVSQGKRATGRTTKWTALGSLAIRARLTSSVLSCSDRTLLQDRAQLADQRAHRRVVAVVRSVRIALDDLRAGRRRHRARQLRHQL